MDTKQPVAVLGCGPAGLLAAHAAMLNGHPVAIISTGEKSRLGGAQYLHQAIPFLTDVEPEAVVKHKHLGTREGYHHKVYPHNEVPVEAVSFGQFGDQPAWNLRKAYDQLYAFFSPYLTRVVIKPEDVADIQADGFLAVFNTIPLDKLCLKGHTFVSQTVWVAGGSLLNQSPVEPVDDNTVIYNGDPNNSWYRCSKTFGIGTAEWPEHHKPPLGEDGNLVKVTKPLKTNCDCHPEVVRLGRYGRWSKGVLSHSAFYDVHNFLNNETGVDVHVV